MSDQMRIVEYDGQTQDAWTIMNATGPADFENQMGIAFSITDTRTDLFFYHSGTWRNV
jgi:hypothetical protein